MRIDKTVITRLIREAVRRHLILEDDDIAAPKPQPQTQSETDRIELLEKEYDKAKIAYIAGIEALLSTTEAGVTISIAGMELAPRNAISKMIEGLGKIEQEPMAADASDDEIRFREDIVIVSELMDEFVKSQDFGNDISTSLKSSPGDLSDALYSFTNTPENETQLDLLKASMDLDLNVSDFDILATAFMNLEDCIEGLNTARARLDTEKADVAARIEREQSVADMLNALKAQQDDQALASFKQSFVSSNFDYQQSVLALDSVYSNLMKPLMEAEVAARKSFAEKYGDMSDAMTEIEDAVMSKDAITQALPTDGGMINTNLETIRDNLKDIVAAMAAMPDDAPLSTADPAGPELTYIEDTLQMLTDLLGTDLESASIKNDDEETIDFGWIRSTREELVSLYNYHDADYELPPIPEKKKPMASKKDKVAKGWAGYVKGSNTKKQMQEIWSEIADGNFKTWVRWYNNFRKTGKTGTTKNYSTTTGYAGKKFGSKTHFSSREILSVMKDLRDNDRVVLNINLNESSQQGLSRGSLYRRRYWGRY